MSKNIRGAEKLLLKIYKGWDEESLKNESFMIQDVLGILMRMERSNTTVVFIQNYYGTQEEKAETIKEVLSLLQNKDDVIILTWAYVSTYEFREEEYYNQYDFDKEYRKASIEAGKKEIPFDEVIERESKLLEELGFEDINNFIGYEYSKAYLYNNSLGNEVINFINAVNK